MAVTATESLTSAIERDGYAFVHAERMRELLTDAGAGTLADWPAFAASWNHLELDRYMADGGRYRRRRHGVFAAARGGGIVRAAHQPHYQSRDYNALNGGIARWFAPITPESGGSHSLTTILAFSRALFSGLAPQVDRWKIEVHQFRIEAQPGSEGLPTPEGMHRDGVDFVLVLLVNRQNIASGTTSIHAPDGRELGRFTLTFPLDAALVDDSRVAHGVTPVKALDLGAPAHRDVLVVTFEKHE